MTRDMLIFDAIRTPRGAARPDGALAGVRPVELVAGLMRELVNRNDLDTKLVDDTVLGCNTQFGDQGANIAKISALLAGWDPKSGGSTVNRFCASGLDAVATAAAKVGAGFAELIVAGGVESMSRVPMFADAGAWFADPEIAARTKFLHMGIAADVLASRHGLTRDDTEAYANRSQSRAAAGWAAGIHDGAVIPVCDDAGGVLLASDACMRATRLEKLARFDPAFAAFMTPETQALIDNAYPTLGAIDHVHTVGSSPAMCDAASLVLIGSARAGITAGLTPRARVVASCEIGSDPIEMLGGVVPALKRAAKQAGLGLGDLDVIECNESFAATPIHLQRSLELDPERVNPNGGAIALGHPLGATGGILLATALLELERSGGRYGAVTIPAGAGIASAMVIERM